MVNNKRVENRYRNTPSVYISVCWRLLHRMLVFAYRLNPTLLDLIWFYSRHRGEIPPKNKQSVPGILSSGCTIFHLSEWLGHSYFWLYTSLNNWVSLEYGILGPQTSFWFKRRVTVTLITYSITQRSSRTKNRDLKPYQNTAELDKDQRTCVKHKLWQSTDTVDERNSSPPGMYKTLFIMG